MINAKAIIGSAILDKKRNTEGYRNIMKVENGRTIATDGFVGIVIDTNKKGDYDTFYLTVDDIKRINNVLKLTKTLAITQDQIDKIVLSGEDESGDKHTISIERQDIYYPNFDAVIENAENKEGITATLDTKKLLQVAKIFAKFSNKVKIKITDKDEPILFTAADEDKQTLKGLLMTIAES